MAGLYLTLSLRYLKRRWTRAALIVLSIASGVGLLVASQSLTATMGKAAERAGNPLGGLADLIVTNGDAPVDARLAKQLAALDGVADAHPRVYADVKLPSLNDRPGLLIGLDLLAESRGGNAPPFQAELEPGTEGRFAALALFGSPAVVGKGLADATGGAKSIAVRAPGKKAEHALARAGTIDGKGPAAMLGGNVLIVDLTTARRVLELKPHEATRIDVTLKPGADRNDVRRRVAEVVSGRGEVRTPEEQNDTVKNPMVGMQVGLQLSGVAALVIGLFLVYNALSVNVAERRHEIGMLMAVGATRTQIKILFAGEAALLGLAGSLLGIPIGIGVAYLGLGPVQTTLSDIFFTVELNRVEVSVELMIAAVAAGVLTAVAAALVPAVLASRENPALAVRRIPYVPSWRHRALQVGSSLTVMAAGVACVLLRAHLPPRFGMYAGLAGVVVGSLLATPFLTAVLARLLLPLLRRVLGVEGRLAADNLVRAPGRTGLVIAALAAGVALVVQTAGIIRSNRVELREWVEQSIAADLFVSAGSPVSAGGRGLPMDERLGVDIKNGIKDVAGALPVRMRKQAFRDTQVFMIALNTGDYYDLDKARHKPVMGTDELKRLAGRPDGVVVSDNFTALHGVDKGDTLTLSSPRGPVTLHVVDRLVDYSWTHGTLIVNRDFYIEHWGDRRVDVFDVYLDPKAPPSRADEVRREIVRRHGAEFGGLVVLTREELQKRIDDIIGELYGIAVAQQVAVMVVAALGVVMALLISVLQRRRELGLLRAVGASRGQVLRSVLAEAALMGFFGTLIGLVVGVPLEWYALRVVLVEETGFVLPVLVPWAAMGWIAAASLATAILAGIGPALYAARQPIAEAVTIE